MLQFVLIGMVLGGLLTWLIGKLFGGRAPVAAVEAAKPTAWNPNITSDLNTVLSDLGNVYGHSYISRFYLSGSPTTGQGVYKSPVDVAGFSTLLVTTGTISSDNHKKNLLLMVLAYEELNYSVGNSNRDLFTRWKNLINTIKNDLPTGTSTADFTLIPINLNKLRAFYLAAVKAYIVGEFNSVSARASSAPYLWTAPGSGLQGAEFFADSLWATYTSAWSSLNVFLTSYTQFSSGVLGLTVTLPTAVTDTNNYATVKTINDVIARVSEKGANDLSTYLSDEAAKAIKYLNTYAVDSAISSAF